MDMARLFGSRRGMRIVGEPIAITVGDDHSKQFYDAFCGRTERAFNTGMNNILKRVIYENRLNNSSEFCKCGECENIDGLPLSYMYCCKEAVNVGGTPATMAAMNLINKIGDLSCITKHSSFDSICLDVEVLNMLSTHKNVCTIWPGPEETLTNCDYRYVAFRAFSYWTHGDDSRGNLFEPPLCVLHKIIEKFPFERPIPSQQKGLLKIFGIDFYSDYNDE